MMREPLINLFIVASLHQRAIGLYFLASLYYWKPINLNSSIAPHWKMSSFSTVLIFSYLTP